jgi:hypothetical protein
MILFVNLHLPNMKPPFSIRGWGLLYGPEGDFASSGFSEVEYCYQLSINIPALSFVMVIASTGQ